MTGTAPKSRASGIPAPGRVTPSRIRSSSSAASTYPTSLTADSEAIGRAFQEAIKANDPSRHSQSIPAAPRSATFQRPTSAAANRPKTPTVSRGGHRRTESRQSDVFSRHYGPYEVGDGVRIESLGFEGMLRFVGEIDGKEGLFAGIELSGGFTGKGKNDGSVAGKYYFSCAPQCGVFVLYDKLSSPTVGLGAISRPTSVASSRQSMPGPGRVTPSLSTGQLSARSYSGRATPRSSTSGRVTPSSSYGFTATTPGTVRPKSAAAKARAPIPKATTPSASAMSKITAGSRASKYIGVTASQLSARGGALASPSRTNTFASPARVVSASPSHSSSMASPSTSGSLAGMKGASRGIGLGTPKSFGGGRPSLTTPKTARIPSAIAMPPPPSPPSGGSNRSASMPEKSVTPTFSSASNDTAVDDDGMMSMATIRQNSKALQEKIASLANGKRTPSGGSTSTPDSELESKQALISTLQERLTSMEEENSRLRTELSGAQEAVEKVKVLEMVRKERDEAVSQKAEVESQLKIAERNVKERSTKIESLERSLQSSAEALSSQRTDSEARLKELRDQLDDTVNLTNSLKEAVEVKSNEAGQNEGIIKAKNTEIELLDSRVKKACAELDDVRRELTSQVDELRMAGQETIALYEERLSAADAKRYELEDLIESLEERVKKQEQPVSPSAILENMSEAARIDHETMREQIVHLQKKITMLEDALEDAQVVADREEAAVRARIQRFKEAEVTMKKEVADARREIENLRKAEVTAKDRVAELEEALREEGMALENARADVESLRAEVADLEGQRAGLAAADRSTSEESFRREKTRQNEEIAQLKEHLESARAARKESAEALDKTRSELIETQHSMSILSQRIEALDSDKAELEQAHADLTARLERERLVTNELRAALDQKTSEVDSAARKNLNRDRPLNGGTIQDIPPAPPTPQDKSAKEEIKGLKHIIQELQKEIAALTSQNKLLESENKFLLSETNQLREDLKSLEDNIEQSLLMEEQALANGSKDSLSVNGVSDGQLNAKHDIEMEQLRKKMTETEMKSARTIHDLNKEVSELESLVEAKIYREDELEREIERLKQKLASRDKKSKSSTEPGLPDHRQRKSSTSMANGSSASDTVTSSQEACEICEQPGHDIFSCPLLKDSSSPTEVRPRALANHDLYCEDCEGHGHVAADCPYSNDVF